jgi:exopolyphosphatase/guanosine-5'-triphosphate,3'-diphosphate pyrophosphatase
VITAEPLRAVIDIGSNSILLLVASRAASGKLVIERDLATVARLSEGASERGSLDPVAIERALAVLRTYARMVRELGLDSLRAIATEGVRMVADPSPFLEPAREILGVPIEAISGDEEARLSYRSVALEEAADAELRVIDIGGASTELVAGRGMEVELAVSHPVGSVRLTERHIDSDPPSSAGVRAVEQAARESFASQPLPPRPELHGLAGTVTTTAALLLGLAAYDRKRVDGARFAYAQVIGLRDRLAGMTLAERLELPCLGPGRADVIVAGATVLLVAMRHCGAGTLVVRDRGLRYALV